MNGILSLGLALLTLVHAQGTSSKAPAQAPQNPPVKQTKVKSSPQPNQGSNAPAPSTPQPSKANQSPAPKNESPKDQTSADADNQFIKVTIDSSRSQVATGGGYGIYADFQNLKDVPITLYPGSTTLVVMPELADDVLCVYYLNGFFPTEPPDKGSPLGGPILIQPKEHYKAFWNVISDPQTKCFDPKGSASAKSWWSGLFGAGSWFASRRDDLGFVPGDYSFVVVGKAFIPPGQPNGEYHTFTQSTKLHVGISQLTAVFAAMLGGIIAYVVAGLRGGGEFQKLKDDVTEKRRTIWNRRAVLFRRALSAAFISGVVTVILSRVSDTQFPIKITVSDVWGSFVIGFIAYFTGNNLIDRIVGFATKSKDGGGGAPTPDPNKPNKGPAAPPQGPQQQQQQQPQPE